MLQYYNLNHEYMKHKFNICFYLLLSACFVACAQNGTINGTASNAAASVPTFEKINKSEAEWKELLSPEEYQVLREQGTELAFSGEYWSHEGKGIYVCAACGLDLFSSKHKFKSASGWPSFYQPLISQNVGTEEDRAFGMVRTEVHCARCGGHLGHVFEDGPRPTGLRYCINSISLDFKPE